MPAICRASRACARGNADSLRAARDCGSFFMPES
nr:MAG TPA: hypothetical protein [Bacteriophage sp.]